MNCDVNIRSDCKHTKQYDFVYLSVSLPMQPNSTLSFPIAYVFVAKHFMLQLLFMRYRFIVKTQVTPELPNHSTQYIITIFLGVGFLIVQRYETSPHKPISSFENALKLAFDNLGLATFLRRRWAFVHPT